MSGLMSALLDPGVDALLGAAQGFGQAALPSRLPVPLGAALGMGAGGALQGVQTSGARPVGATADPGCADAEPSHCVGVACDTC